MTDEGSLAKRTLSAAGWLEASSRGVPHLVVAPASASVLWANAAAGTIFGTSDPDAIASALFTADRAPRGLATRLMRLVSGAPDRLERMSLASAFKVELITLLCKSVRDAALGPLTVLQVASPTLPQTVPSPSIEVGRSLVADTPSAVAQDAAAVATPSTAVPSGAKSLDEWRADWAARWPGTDNRRFLWALDQDGRIASVGEELALTVGHLGLRVGDMLVERLAEMAPEVVDDVTAALARRRSWRESVLWPIAGIDASIVLELGGAPRDGAYRGYGVIRLDRLSGAAVDRASSDAAAEAAEAELPDPIPADTVAAEPEPEGGPAAIATETPPDKRSPDAAGLLERSGYVRARARSSVPDDGPLAAPHAKVVHLSAFKTASGMATLPVPRPAPPEEIAEPDAAPLPDAPLWAEMAEASSGPDGTASSRLSRNERFNFDEIARTLGARAAGEDEPAHVPTGDHPELAAIARRAIAEEAAILDALPLAIAVTRAREVLYLNRTLLDLLGFSSLDAGVTARVFGGAEGSFEAAPASLVASDGTAIPVDAHVNGIGWGGESATLISFRRAVDDEAEARAQASRLDLEKARTTSRDLEAAAELAASGIAFLDPEGRLLAISAGAERLFGYDQKEVVGDNCSIFSAADQRFTWQSFFRDFAASGPARRTTAFRRFAGVRRDGTPLRLAASLRWIEGEKICIVWNDDGGRRASGNELETLRREAERSSALKSEFLAKVSHEIRTPLNAILGFTDIIMEERFGPINNERYKEYMKDIHASGQHVMSLVNDLLDLSRIEAGGLDLNLQPVDVNALVGESVTTMQGQAQRDRVIIRTSLATHLPQVLADVRALKQIMLNLLSNAVKFNEPGGQVIVSTAAVESGRIAIRVRDTGLGMSEDEIETAMKPFGQLATPKSAAGSGLGLPLTKALVEASRGGMTIKSRPREGTLVEITFERVSKPELSLPAE